MPFPSQNKLHEGKLVRIPGMLLSVAEAVFVYRHRARPVNPIVEAFIDMVRAAIDPAAARGD